MSKNKSKRKYFVRILLILILFIILNNCNFVTDKSKKNISLLAHRGLGQTFEIENAKWNTNTAKIIYPPEHFYIENTIPSIKAAFNYGADMVEFDIRVTRDKKLVVFHDYIIDFRTNGHGKVSDFTLKELQKLDVGYGYTHDEGKSYPLRGKGVGLMTSIEDIFKNFKGKAFLIHIKDSGNEIGELLLMELSLLSTGDLENISIYGNDQAIKTIKKRYPQVKTFSKKIIKKALISYELIGWSGYIPENIKNVQLHLPIQYAKFLWGWPEKFLERMKSVNTKVFLVNMKGKWSGGFDNENDLALIPGGYSGYVWTNRIDTISSSVKKNYIKKK
ncbi:MAG: glycerophosphodiester phosphodiesterase [Deltaproteobacteria bacterium]|nr:glycerophosphodiester phosphodiesterase [Deltaproteobacteria bacterium]